MDLGQARTDPSSRPEDRLPLAIHQSSWILRNAYRNRVPNPGDHRSSPSISFPANLWRLSTTCTRHNVRAISNLQFGVQQCSSHKQSSGLGIPNPEHSLPSLQRHGPSCGHAHVLPVLRRPIQAPI